MLGGEQPVELPVPEIDAEQCAACGRCVEVCEYGALIALGEQILVFPELCHGCGGCRLVCPEGAIRETGRRIGVVEEGEADAIHFIRGRLDIGQALSPPVIRAASRRLPRAGVQLIDAPPGTACAAVQAVEGADYVVLVAEPTPFGVHDFLLSVEMLRLLGLPFGTVINRADEGTGAFRQVCAGGEWNLALG